jgi:drug/metabolite transporter (DMT)-like permease
MAATENKGTAIFPGASAGISTVQADRLAKRGYDFIPAAILVVALFALLALSVWFAAYAWTHLGGDPVPTYGYVAIAGGVVISLLVGGGLMALVFYSSRHGYDDLSGGDN